MSENIVFHALDLSGELSLTLFIRKDDGSLLNAGGDLFVEIGTSGTFAAVLDESRAGLGPLSVRVCDGSETAENIVYDDFLPESSTTIGVMATIPAAVQAKLDLIEAVTTALGLTASQRLSLSANEILPFTVDTVTNGHTPTSLVFQSADFTEATASHYNGRIIIWRTGALAEQATSIAAYELVGGIGQFTVIEMTEAAATGDQGIIL